MSRISLNFDGKTWVIFGKSDTFDPVLSLPGVSASEAINLFPSLANDSASGSSVSSAGDINGDGLADLIIGAPYAGPHGLSGVGILGEVYVVFGRDVGSSDIDLANLDPSEGLILGVDGTRTLTGASVSGAGDLNGDGFDDLIFGSPAGVSLSSFATNVPGESIVVFGKDFNDIVDQLGGPGDDSLTGTDADEILIGAQGNDTIDGGSGSDTLKGGAGDDVLDGGLNVFLGQSGGDQYYGGSGADTFVFQPDGASSVGNFGRIHDFAPGEDMIELSGFGIGFSDLDTNGDGVLDVNDTSIISALGFGNFSINLGDINFLEVVGVNQLEQSDLIFS